MEETRAKHAAENMTTWPGVRIEVPSVEPPGYTRWNWWKTEKGLAPFRTEFLKYMYYRLIY